MSDIHALQDNEALIGKWLKRTGNRDKVFIATKVGYYHKPEVRLVNGDADYIVEAANKSLKALDIPTIDLLYLHVRLFLTRKQLFISCD